MTDGISYRGNANLKRLGAQFDITPEMLLEYDKCSRDPIYFAENYIKIVHVDRGLIPMKMYDYQKEIVEKITHNRRVSVCTSRQAGKTTTAVAVILHYILFNEHKLVALLANKGDAAREILERIKIAYEALPSWLQQGVVEWNKGSVHLENGCKVLASSTSSSAIRGKSASFLYIDETAFVENWIEFFSSVFPTITSGKETKLLFTSTPKGLNHFYKICDGAMKGPEDEEWNGYHYIEVKWDRVPGRDAKWKHETLSSMDFDEQQFSQEFECAFMGSSGTLIEGWKLKELVSKRPLVERDNMKMYERAEEGHSYCLVADVSRGKGLDYSAFSIFDITSMPYKQVCTFRANDITPYDYAGTISRFVKIYNEAYVLIEINDIGEQVSELLHYDLECETVLFTEHAGRSGKRISGGFGKSVDKGIRTTKSVKAIGCNTIKMLVEQDQLIINDFHTIEEFSTFSKNGISYEAEPGCHDDTVMVCVLFGWLSGQQFFRDMTDIHTLNKLKQKTDEQFDDDMLPFGFMDDGSPLEEEMPIIEAGTGTWMGDF